MMLFKQLLCVSLNENRMSLFHCSRIMITMYVLPIEVLESGGNGKLEERLGFGVYFCLSGNTAG